MKFNVTFKVIWDGDYEFIDFEFDSKDLESLHRNIKTAIDEKYLEPERDIKKTINGEVTITYTSIKDSMGNEIYTK
ncbi:MAG: hypothetical protein ACKVI2_02170 [Candidatus Pelagibacterales bacterium]|jgi:hypothetical protein|nr:hypothetical protein [Pelagibacterales bacterium]MDA7763828.1 hypothetical protein [Pelagibacterales bacterium]|tara:strand:+ start:747 stop:974 length:228 start_codon:yes stop_codon:yes gene_type:complete